MKDTILPIIDKAIQLYTRHGFAVHEIADCSEFECLIGDLPPIHVNVAAYGEHVPKAENFAKVIKERMRCLLNGVPFEAVPRTMVVAGLTFVTNSLNAVSAGDDISASLSLATIVTGHHPPDLSCLKLTYGDHVKLHVKHKPYNSMKSHTVPCIALHSVGNTQGGYYFMDLHFSCRHIGQSWTSLPMTGDVVARVEQLALDDGQPCMRQGPIIEFAPDVPVADLPVGDDDLAVEDFPIAGAPAAEPLAHAANPVQPVPLFEANPIDAEKDATNHDDDDSSNDKRAVDPVHVHDLEPVAPILQAVEPVAEPVAADAIHDNDDPFGILGDEKVILGSEEEAVSLGSKEEEDQGIKALQHELQEAEANFNADEQDPTAKS